MHSAIYPTVRECHLNNDFPKLNRGLSRTYSECSVSATRVLMLKTDVYTLHSAWVASNVEGSYKRGVTLAMAIGW